MIKITSKGSFKNTNRFLNRMSKGDIFDSLDAYGREGVRALANATPMESGVSASSWRYDIRKRFGRYTIVWSNENTNQGVPIVILIQYGHGTGTGGYVQGRDFINPVIRPLFDRIANDVWKEVQRA